MTEFIDPLNDPRFPNRPTHDDFWRISESVLGSDAAAKDDFIKAVMEFVDLRSVMYMASQRTGMIGMPEAQPAWIDGFLVGVRFAQAGGHRET